MSKESSWRLKISFACYCSADSFPCIFIFNQDSVFCRIGINQCPFPFWVQLWMINKTNSSLQIRNTSYFSWVLFCTFSILQCWHGTSQQSTISTPTLLLLQCHQLLEKCVSVMMKAVSGWRSESKDHGMEELYRGRHIPPYIWCWGFLFRNQKLYNYSILHLLYYKCRRPNIILIIHHLYNHSSPS